MKRVLKTLTHEPAAFWATVLVAVSGVLVVAHAPGLVIALVDAVTGVIGGVTTRQLVTPTAKLTDDTNPQMGAS